MQNHLVRVTSVGRNSIGLSRLGGGASGALDLEKRKLGVNNLAETVTIFRYTSKGLETVSLNDLGSGTIANSEIGYAHLNWANQVDIIVLGGGNTNTVLYGRTSLNATSSSLDTRYITINTPDGSYGPYRTNYEISGGAYVAAVLNANGDGFNSLKRLEAKRDVPNTAWTGQGAVTIDGRTYSIPSNVMCYNRDIGDWVTLEQAHAYAKECDIFVSDDGVVRAIEIDTRFYD